MDSSTTTTTQNNDAIGTFSADVAPVASAAATFDEEWEEWDGSSPFWVHCVAGSTAGVAEHVLVYPLDTVRTHIQVCAACNFNSATHNASTQAATMAAKGSSSSRASKPSVPGAVLQKAAASVSTTKIPKIAVRSAKTAAGRGGMNGGVGGLHNLSMVQAIRQLVSQQPLALETSAAAATATTTTAGSSTASAAMALKNAASSVTSSSSSTSSTIPMESQLGMSRLWRGVQTILVGCIPAHALYFSTYEIVKAATLDEHGEVTAYGSALAGGAAVVSHDMILGPLDTVKQRLQLGHYNGLTDALTQMIRTEGVVSLLRSFPITLATNIPYGMIMVGTNEVLKDQWTKLPATIRDDGSREDGHNHSELTLGVTLGASSLAGLVAAATTTPLDRIKTYLQTQQLAPSCLLQNDAGGGKATTSCPYGGKPATPIVSGWREAAVRIYRQEGTAGFFRGVTPRILSHTPAVAISWTTYEAFKRYLQNQFCGED